MRYDQNKIVDKNLAKFVAKNFGKQRFRAWLFQPVLEMINRGFYEIMSDIDDIKNDISTIKTGVATLIDKVNTQTAALADVQSKLDAAIADDTGPEVITDLKNQLGDIVTELQSATADAAPLAETQAV